jgi:hypothetical protein
MAAWKCPCSAGIDAATDDSGYHQFCHAFRRHFCFEAIGVFEVDTRNGVFARFDPSSSRHWFRPP